MKGKNKVMIGAVLTGLLLGTSAHACDFNKQEKSQDKGDQQSKNKCGKMMKKSGKKVVKENSCSANKCGANSCG